jgi:deoxyhypusine synthase
LLLDSKPFFEVFSKMIIQTINDVLALETGRLIVWDKWGVHSMESVVDPDEVRRTAAIILGGDGPKDFASQAEVVAAGLRAEGRRARAFPSE